MFSDLDKKSKKSTINLIYEKRKCFQYAITVALNHEEFKKQNCRE